MVIYRTNGKREAVPNDALFAATERQTERSRLLGTPVEVAMARLSRPVRMSKKGTADTLLAVPSGPAGLEGMTLPKGAKSWRNVSGNGAHGLATGGKYLL